MAARKNKAFVGRKEEVEIVRKVLGLKKHLLVEGPVGVGKTALISHALQALKVGFERVDGDGRYSEQKLAGWFDPPLVLKKGYSWDTFAPGPLVIAMQKGCALFINELNRLPESVQNVLLPAMDERKIVLPKLGTIEAKDGFFVVATQNPREFTATQSLSEALLDRFELLRIDYPSQEEERAIVQEAFSKKVDRDTVERVVGIVRATRDNPKIKRGASLRAGISILELMETGLALEVACRLALPTRIELVSWDEDWTSLWTELLSPQQTMSLEKKKSRA